MDIPLRLLLLIALTFFNAFFAAAEIALLQINDAKYKKLAEEGDKKAARLVKLTSNSASLLSNIQVCITLSGFLASAFAADSFADRLTALVLGWLPSLNSQVVKTVSIVVITLILSYFTLVFGELLPKKIALTKKDKIARSSVGVLNFTSVLFYPFIKLLSGSVNLFLRMFGIDPNAEEDNITEEEIKLMVEEGQEQGNIDDDEKELINNVFEFGDTTCGDIMVPRTEVVAVDVDTDFDSLVRIASKERFSRIPVYEGSIDNIIGFIHIKSLLGLDNSSFDLRSLIIPAVYVAESQKIDAALEDLKKEKAHLAVVIDEFGGTAGIITMEDIIEELVGSIQDEYDEEEKEPEDLILEKDTGEYAVAGSTDITDVNETLDLDIPDDEYNTISGFAVEQLGEIPDEGEFPEFDFEGIHFKVTESDGKTVKALTITLPPKQSEDKQ